MRISLFAVVVVIVLSGCNTMFQDSFEKIMVRTTGVENANCILSTEKQKYLVLSGRRVVVERSNLPLTVACEKAGYYSASVIVKSHVHANAAALNVFNGIVPGTAYDIASNSIYEYPETIIVTLLPMPAEKQEPEQAPYVLPLKQSEVKPAPVASAPPAAAADKTMSTSGKK